MGASLLTYGPVQLIIRYIGEMENRHQHRIGFDSIADAIDERFKIHQLELGKMVVDEELRKEMTRFVLGRVDQGKTAYEGFSELLDTTEDKKLIKEILNKLMKM